MKAITIHQPWASLIAIGAKHFETRGWKTNYRGPIAIHAAKKDPHATMLTFPHDISKSIYNSFYEKLGIQSGALKKMTTGSIIATAILTECYEIHIDHTGDAVLVINQVPKIWIGSGTNEFAFGDYSNWRYAWQLDNIRVINPVAVKGQQGLWNWGEDGTTHEQ